MFSLSPNSGEAGTLEALSSQADQLTSATIYKKHTCVIDTEALTAEARQPPLPLTPTASEARLRGTRAREERLWVGSSARGCSGFQRLPRRQSWRPCCSCSSGPNPARKRPEGVSCLGTRGLVSRTLSPHGASLHERVRGPCLHAWPVGVKVTQRWQHLLCHDTRQSSREPCCLARMSPACTAAWGLLSRVQGGPVPGHPPTVARLVTAVSPGGTWVWARSPDSSQSLRMSGVTPFG